MEGNSTLKRKHSEIQDVPKKQGLFTDGHMPEGVFPIGDNVFVAPTICLGFVTVYLRRYKKYRKVYYPTGDEITLRPSWVEYIMGRKKVPQMKSELPRTPSLPKEEIQITSEDFSNFCFKRIYRENNVSRSKEMIIKKSQWCEMIKKYDDISTTVLDLMYKNMCLRDAYMNYCETPIVHSLPASFDVSLGEEYLHKILKKSICDIFIDSGMKKPETIAEELLGNRVKTFNSFAFSLEVMELAGRFYSNLWDNQKSLSLKPAHYVTEEFFNNLRLDVVLRDARNFMCPLDPDEYYEDSE